MMKIGKGKKLLLLGILLVVIDQVICPSAEVSMLSETGSASSLLKTKGWLSA